MTDPIQQLQRYGHEVDVTVAPITPEEVRGRLTPLVPESGPSRIPAWFVAVGVAAALVFILGGVSLLLGGSDDSNPTATTPPPTAAPSPLTLGVEVLGVSGREGNDLAGVLYEGGELSDLDRDAVGGFWTVVASDDYSTTEVVREPGDVGEGRFPYVTSEALTVEPGTYTLVLWVDTSISEVSRWVPLNTDGMGLSGCQYVFEVTADTGADITVSPTFVPNGWNTHCTTGAVVPGTDADEPVGGNTDG